jgi:FlaA1/EpsC-like NDP-sugar epimerase
MEGVDVVLHAAAYKHVHLCEESPRDAIHTNVLGVQNIIDAAEGNQVERVVLTSSDKAVNPTSVMGTSKLMGERLFTAADSRRRGTRPIFASTRFGNVLGSRGSVIPLFHQQIRQGGPVTLTDVRMTRFIMTLKEAVGLVMESVFLARGGEVFVTKMPVVRIEDLAVVMIQELAPQYGRDPESIELQVIGPKPGEKVYEELLNEEEVRRTTELDKYYLVHRAVPALPGERFDRVAPGAESTIDHAYNSAGETPMSREELREYLHEHDLVTQAERGSGGRP